MFINNKKTTILSIASGILIGIFTITGVDKLISDSDSMRNAIYASHEKCIHSANIANDDTHPQRALRITDCMAGNNYIFTGTKPTSICYAENQMHIVVKHILPSCYESPSLISKFLKLLQIS